MDFRGRQDLLEVVDDVVEDLAVEIDEVHLVDGERELGDPQELRDPRVPPRLDADAVARVHQQNRHVGGRGAGGHVARVLLVPRRVGQDELAARGGEIPVRDVDRDPLLALRLEAVGEQREVDRPGRCGSSTPSRPS